MTQTANPGASQTDILLPGGCLFTVQSDDLLPVRPSVAHHPAGCACAEPDRDFVALWLHYWTLRGGGGGGDGGRRGRSRADFLRGWYTREWDLPTQAPPHARVTRAAIIKRLAELGDVYGR